MQFSLSPANLSAWSGSVLVVGVHEQDPQGLIGELETRLGLAIAPWLERQRFQGKGGELAKVQLLRPEISSLILVGLGAAASPQLPALRQAAANAAKACNAETGSVGVLLPWSEQPAQATAEALSVAEAIRLALYSDVRFRSKPDPRTLPERFELLGTLPADTASALERVGAICAGVELARELVAAPPNSVTPAALADSAATIAQAHGLELKVLERADCAKRGMGAYLAVSQGSDLDPKFIHLTYRPNGAVRKRLVLVGKGLTFDSGGYNLKVGAAQIDMMKYDMGGSAAVIGAMRAIAELRPEGVEVHMLVASCENMVNGSAVHPGDIVTASNGTTIEINNTDAEGRLTLADALVYASELKPDAIVDLATLTGACVIALGEEIAGLWSDHDDLADGLRQAAEQAGEGLWRMPMQSSYREGLKSLLADLKNTGPRPGGSITAALFLREFVDREIPWAHMDIAGTVWSDKGRGLDPAGATGYGVRTLVNWICGGGAGANA
ncbi:MAG: leucyl aminopeptidase [Synechococcaceae bacterium WB9_4xC_028]|jgi:leucyl aminopeptidase|uniref:leucyl aminopeptidase n=1 Tax=Synechococcus sp. BS56D TaxID=2055944 RepID=UPI00103B87F4|nr:leucyl aminopeptidase [Synechococcus sp. BS56D]NDD44910.1 leucyl aminopeptidase [Synechococcaceae bacterium WB9_4xB_025]NDD68324.1 leucyl aminopeptidase [Synechococcaceae bacterium WB9_4xC_028]TCD59574.1 leucyl aminopeptidase [Synechococcus sp. BS56D]